MASTRTNTAIVAVALFALSAGPVAAAHSDAVSQRVDAANHATAMRSLAAFHQQIEADLRPVTSPATPTRTVRVVGATVADDGFDWIDGAISAGLSAAVLLAGAGAMSARRHPSATPHRAS